jgi:hypothetical protein
MKAFWAAALLAGALSCGGGGTTGNGATAGGGDGGGGTGSLVGRSTNPDGVPYPAGPYGHDGPRGSAPGSVIENFTFLGYPGGDKSKGLVPVSLADSYDPCGKRWKMIHLDVSGIWCTGCNQETDALVAAKPQLDTDGIAIVQILDDGRSEGVAATPSDLDLWIQLHQATSFTEVLNPDGNLAGFFNPKALPWNADIDPRTMEIVYAGIGIETDVTTALASIPATPAYPVTVSCN